MIDLKNIKKKVNPLNAVVTAIILLFVCIRVFSNNHENAFIIEAINPTETHVKTKTQIETQLETQIETQIETQAVTQIQTEIQKDEPVAYSSELGKIFTLDAFNNLSKDDLMTFSGIGEVTAQAILDYRKVNGPFNDFDELMLVKGIGEKKLQKIMTILP